MSISYDDDDDDLQEPGVLRCSGPTSGQSTGASDIEEWSYELQGALFQDTT